MVDRFGGGQTSRTTPSIDFRDLAVGEIHDTNDLIETPKAIEIENSGAATLKVKMRSGKGNTAVISVPSGTTRLFCGAVTRIYSTGSDNLVTYINAGTAGVVLHLE